MTTARQTTYKKRVDETKSFAINCSGVLGLTEPGEIIAMIDEDGITQTDADGVDVDEADQVDIAGLIINTETICVTGEPEMQIGEAMIGFFVAGKTSVTQPYLINIPFTSSAGQELVAEIRLRIY